TLRFLFVMPPPPSPSTLFPYTTLFRSTVRRSSKHHFVSQAFTRTPRDLPWNWWVRSASTASSRPRSLADGGTESSRSKKTRSARSEEHTSELQSPDHLVCRLLLENKNN